MRIFNGLFVFHYGFLFGLSAMDKENVRKCLKENRCIVSFRFTHHDYFFYFWLVNFLSIAFVKPGTGQIPFMEGNRSVRLFIESFTRAQVPLGENAFFYGRIISLKAGEP